jgi:hypothetical protein
VFDVSQTDGEPLPEFAEVTGDPGAYVALLKAFLVSRNIELSYANAELGTAHGASLKGRILLRDDLPAAVTFSVLVHQVAHELLHTGDGRSATSKTVRETEAEAVAFVVSHAIGLATGTAASDYIQLYAGDKATLPASLGAIQHAATEILTALHGDEHGHLFLVADGMGGHRAGEQASALAVVAIEQFTLNTFKWFFHSDAPDAQRVLTQFQTALREADVRILDESIEHPELTGMGTTVTMAYHLDSQLCVVHVGDRRAYIFEDDGLHQITHDHTLMAEMVRRGALQPEEVAHHRLRHVITNVVGGNEAGVNVEAHALKVDAGESPAAVFGRIERDADKRGDRRDPPRGAGSTGRLFQTRGAG